MKSGFAILLCSLFLWGAKPVTKENCLSSCEQLLVVTAKSWDSTKGNLSLYARSHSLAPWICQEKNIPVVLGSKGLGWGRGLYPKDYPANLCKKEGDKKSPAGIFSLGPIFGLLPQKDKFPKMDYLFLDENIEAVDDNNSSYYNQIVNAQKVKNKDWKSSEKMGKEPLYKLGLVINHNFPLPTVGEGSAIFLHIWRQENSPTLGCTAMSEENVQKVLLFLDQKKHPLLVQVPDDVYQEMEKKLPLPLLEK